MPHSPLVSILVTIYNRANILEATVESALLSSFNDFEIILVDDCSRDSSWDIAQKLASEHKNIRAFRNTTNLGDYGNRNKAASLARGKYIKYLDADDIIYRYSLAMMVEALEAAPNAALALSSNVIDPVKPYPFAIEPREFQLQHYLGKSPLGVGPSAAIIRKDHFDKVGGFSGKQFVGDSELWVKLANRWSIVLLPPALVWWRRHEGQQISFEQKSPEVLNTRFELELQSLSQADLLTPEEKNTANRRLRQHYARKILSVAFTQKRPYLASKLFCDSSLNWTDLLKGFRKYS
jgi:glycosyltransferase involved in cell wall biosynthesis